MIMITIVRITGNSGMVGVTLGLVLVGAELGVGVGDFVCVGVVVRVVVGLGE